VKAVAGSELVDAGVQAGFGDFHQTGGLGGDLPHGGRVGGVAVVALDDGTAVDADDVPFDQYDRRRGDAVDDHGVGRSADNRREPVVAEEVGTSAPLLQYLAGDLVDVAGGDTGPDDCPSGLVDLGNHPPGLAHLG
jgi:hypothetical protein